MARRTPGRVQMVTSTTGNGPYTLANPSPALTGKRTIAQAVTDGSLVNGDQVLYAIVDPTAAGSGKLLEVGVGTINTATLVLTVVATYEKSATLTSGGGWGAGTRDVIISPPGAWNTAFLDLANIFTQDQYIQKTSPGIYLGSGGIDRLRIIQSGSTAFFQYLNSSGVVKGSIALGDTNAPSWSPDGNTYKDIGIVETGKTLAQLNAGMKVVQLAGGNVNKIPWYQATAPTGWTKDTSQNDKALRVVSGAGGGNGGSRVLSSSAVGATTLGDNVSHSHVLAYATASVEAFMPQVPISVISSVGAGVGSANTNNSGTVSPSHDHSLSLAYVDIIMCSLD